MNNFQILFCIHVDEDIRSLYSLTSRNFGLENTDVLSEDSIKSIQSLSTCKHDSLPISDTNFAFVKRFDVNILTIRPFIQEIGSSISYRKTIYSSSKKIFKSKCPNDEIYSSNTFLIIVRAELIDSYVIDYAWGLRLWRDCHIRLERECAAAWLSTLGGAFSALGDYSQKFASMAFHTSIQQIRLARISDDGNGVARGWLFLALAMSQLGYNRFPKTLLFRAQEYQSYDPRHKNMCLGVQAKLRYDAKMRRLARKSGIKESPHIIEQKKQIWEIFKSMSL